MSSRSSACCCCSRGCRTPRPTPSPGGARAHLLRAGSITLFGMYGQIPDIITIDLANAILLTSFAVTWTGARVFDGRAPEPVGLMAGAAFWLFMSRLPAFAESMEFRTLVSAGIIAGYTWLTAAEFWRGRDEQLVSRCRRSSCCSPTARCSCCARRSPRMLPWSPTNQVFGSVWLTVLSSEALLFTISIAFILLAMAKERTALRHKTDCDDRSAHRHLQSPRLPAGKRARDQAPGRKSAARRRAADRSRQFQVDQRPLRPRGRRQGAAGLRRDGGQHGAAVRLRRPPRRRGIRRGAVQRRPRARAARSPNASARPSPRRPAWSTARPVAATLSIGMVFSDERNFDVPELLAQADQALYRAKERGRNRVEIATPDRPADGRTTPRRRPLRSPRRRPDLFVARPAGAPVSHPGSPGSFAGTCAGKRSCPRVGPSRRLTEIVATSVLT